MLIYTLMLLSPFIEWLVIDMIAEISATKNNLSRDNLLWPSACFVSSSKECDFEVKWLSTGDYHEERTPFLSDYL